jgi:hypothetical protein
MLNRENWSPSQRKAAGVGVVVLLVAASGLIGFSVEAALPQTLSGKIAFGLIASVLVAQRSLYQHVARVRSAFAEGGLAEARVAVSRIVGRDPEQLDEAGVSRAAIESCAENFSDGVVAPVFWLALLGLPGLIAYKAINTADSMIGHRTARYESFGWAAARVDDLVNFVPARLSGLLLAVVAPIANGAVGTARLMPAGRKAPRPAHWVWHWRDRGATANISSTIPFSTSTRARRRHRAISAAPLISMSRRVCCRRRFTQHSRWWPDGYGRFSGFARCRDALPDGRRAHPMRLRSGTRRPETTRCRDWPATPCERHRR